MAAPAISFSALEKMTEAEQDASLTKIFGTFTGTVTAAWVKNNASLAPYEGDSALSMYEALKTAYPDATPLQRGSTVYQTWLVDGIGSAVGQVIGASGAAVGDVATGVETAQIVPSWSTGLAQFLADIGSRNLWLRVGKVVVGVALIIIGVAQLTHATNIAKTAVKGAVLA